MINCAPKIDVEGGGCMLKRLSRVLLILLGVSLGIALAVLAMALLNALNVITPDNRAWGIVSVILYVSGILVGLLLAIILLGPATRGIERLVRRAEAWIQSTPPGDMLFGSIGVVIGLTIAFLITSLFKNLMVWVGVPLSVAVYLLLGYIGGYFGAKRWRELPLRLLLPRKAANETEELTLTPAEGDPPPGAKVMDTSAIIDGRALDIARAGFLDGPLIVPSFVLDELRHIADSPDDMRRRRGRRGLDILSALQQEDCADLRVLAREDLAEGAEVDVQLLKLAAELGASVLTTDYNLNKVAKLTGVKVLNINELANAVKPVMLAGERLYVKIVREGKEQGQGVAYLDDGTMVVVDGGRAQIGKECEVMVASVLQTAAGRMIFAKQPE